MPESYQVSAFYCGAMLRYDLDDVTVDGILEKRGIVLSDETIPDAVQAVRDHLSAEGHYPAPQPPVSWAYEPY
jgi:transposase-like protein